VYLAKQLLTNQKVALKVIPKLSIKQKDVRAKIEKEVRILKRVNSHSGVIKLYEVFEDRNYVYLVFELLERGDLVNFFRENTLLEEPELKKFFREIGRVFILK
jgi:serine/threonine protein kinase